MAYTVRHHASPGQARCKGRRSATNAKPARTTLSHKGPVKHVPLGHFQTKQPAKRNVVHVQPEQRPSLQRPPHATHATRGPTTRGPLVVSGWWSRGLAHPVQLERLVRTKAGLRHAQRVPPAQSHPPKAQLYAKTVPRARTTQLKAATTVSPSAYPVQLARFQTPQDAKQNVRRVPQVHRRPP